MSIRLVTVCTVAAAIAGCSFRVDFAVVNTSSMDAVLTVHVSDAGACRLSQSAFATAPAKELAPGWFKRNQPRWEPMKPMLFTLENDSCSFTAVIAGGTAMKVAEAYNHPEPEKAELKLLEVQKVSIQWSTGASRDYEPKELAQQFVEARPRLWAIFPEPEA